MASTNVECMKYLYITDDVTKMCYTVQVSKSLAKKINLGKQIFLEVFVEKHMLYS